MKTLEIELEEEKSGTELLNDRITRTREQVQGYAFTRGKEFPSNLSTSHFFIHIFQNTSVVHSLNILLNWVSFKMDQLRSELMQERSARHDLEMDKSSLERQVNTRVVQWEMASH